MHSKWMENKQTNQRKRNTSTIYSNLQAIQERMRNTLFAFQCLNRKNLLMQKIIFQTLIQDECTFWFSWINDKQLHEKMNQRLKTKEIILFHKTGKLSHWLGSKAIYAKRKKETEQTRQGSLVTKHIHQSRGWQIAK